MTTEETSLIKQIKALLLETGVLNNRLQRVRELKGKIFNQEVESKSPPSTNFDMGDWVLPLMKVVWNFAQGTISKVRKELIYFVGDRGIYNVPHRSKF